jgi:predicted component of type VI protein secretion system
MKSSKAAIASRNKTFKLKSAPIVAKINSLYVADVKIAASFRASQVQVGEALTRLKVLVKNYHQKWAPVMKAVKMPYSSSFHYLAAYKNRNKKKAAHKEVSHTTFQKLQLSIRTAVNRFLAYAEEMEISDTIAKKQADTIKKSFVVGISIVRAA